MTTLQRSIFVARVVCFVDLAELRCTRLVSRGQMFNNDPSLRLPVRLSAFCSPNVKAYHPGRAGQHMSREDQQGRQIWRLTRRATAMEKMEVTDEQIHQEKQLVDEEDVFLGKEDITDGTTSMDEGNSTLGDVGSEMRECWDLWQRIGLSVEKIAKRQHMSETGVFFCIFTCIQNNYTVDWYELCKEAQFTLDTAKRMIQSTKKYASQLSGRPWEPASLRQHLPSEVSDVHFGLYFTMLHRGLSYETIMEISLRSRDSKPEMEWGEEYADEERFPREATEVGLLQWFAEKDGVSLIEIALKFRECNDLHLMRLLLKLEKEGKIFWRQGIFRAP